MPAVRRSLGTALERVELTPDGQAARQGIRVGQRIVAFGGVKVSSVEMLMQEVAKAKEMAADGAGTAEVRVTLVAARARGYDC